MPIVASELKMYRATTQNDTSSNGGRITATEILSGQLAGLFPNVTPGERTSGLTRYRKAFFKVANDDDIPLVNPKLWQDTNTPGADRVCFFAATQRDTQSTISGSERKYGVGALQASVLAGVTSLVVTVEDGGTVLFVNGDTIRVSNKANLAGSGDEEFVTINGVPSIVGNNVTIAFTPALAHDFLSTNTRVASVYAPADVAASYSNFVRTSTAGTYNTGTHPVGVDSIGTIEQTWTLTFTNGTTYGIVGDTVGSVGTGNVSGGASPSNPSFAKPYFNLLSGGFGGTYVNGDTIVFQTHPAAVPVWLREVIPAASAVQASNTTSLILVGETT